MVLGSSFPSSTERYAPGCSGPLGWLLLLAVLSVAPARAQVPDASVIVTRLDRLVRSAPALSFHLRSEETLGDETAWTEGQVIRLAADTLRMDVDAGRGSGGTVILKGSQVKAWRRGILSFIRLTYDSDHPRVQSLRGHELGAIGFFDEATWILANTQEARIHPIGDSAGFAFTDASGLDHEVSWPVGDPHPASDVVRDKGIIVERYLYRSIAPATGEERRMVVE